MRAETVGREKKEEYGMADFKLEVTPEMEALTDICIENSKMDVALYGKYNDVKRGLRDINGKGVLAGLDSDFCDSFHRNREWRDRSL